MPKTERIAVTLRVPRELIERANALRNGSGSFNEFVVRALEAELKRRELAELFKKIDEEREQTFREHGLLSDSRQLIRDLREGIGRYD